MKYLICAAVLVPIALTSAACGSTHRVKVSSSSYRPNNGAVVARAQEPTKYLCAAAWNQGALPSVLAWEQRLHVWEATVGSGTGSESTVSFGKGQKATTTAGRKFQYCEVVLFAQRGRATILSGMWVRGAVASWGHPRQITPLPGSGNACVARDGAIYRVGPFTARSRCARTA